MISFSFSSLAIKNNEDNGPTNRDQSSSGDLLCDVEQWVDDTFLLCWY